MAADPLRRMRAAVREVRREARKVAFIYAVVDASVAFIGTLLVVAVLDPAPLRRELAIPRDLGAVEAGLVLAAGLGLVTLVVEFAWRLRRPMVERFEAANPAVHEALRTARDALEDGSDTPMARALYESVTDRLGATSSRELVDMRRLGATVVLVLVLSVLTVQASISAVHLGLPEDGRAGGRDPGGPAAGPTTFEGLQPGEAVLGAPQDITPGSENVSAEIDPVTGGTGDGAADGSDYDQGGLPPGSGPIDPQRAGFDPPPDLEEADLIREYNLRIRDVDEGDER